MSEFFNAADLAAGRCNGGGLEFTQEKLKNWGLCDVTLRPYQLDGVRWLAERHTGGCGCILGDEMGLGKTLQVIINNQVHCIDHLILLQSISFLVYLQQCVQNQGPFLILVPLSVINNWESEISRSAPKELCISHSGSFQDKIAAIVCFLIQLC